MAEHILENESLRLRIADAGAELCAVWDKELAAERLWNADPAVWNRHAPILFPFVGRVVGGKYRIDGREYTMKTQHGFARDMVFRCLEETAEAVCHELRATEETRAIYPYDFRLLVRHRLDGRQLHVEWELTNEGTERMYYAIGGHPGFLPPEGVRKEDCFLGFPGKGSLRYFGANAAGFALPEAVKELRLEGGFAPYGSDIPDTWIFEKQGVDLVQIVRPDRTPWVTMRCGAFPILAVWANPAGPFLCLEPWIGRCDDEGFTGDISEKACEAQLAPGECARIGYSIEFHR